MRFLPLILTLFAVCLPADAQVLRLKDDTTLQGDIISASTQAFKLEGGFTVPVKKALQLHFMELEPVTSGFFQPIPEIPGEADSIFSQAEALEKLYPQEQGLALRDYTDITLKSDGTWTVMRRFTALAKAFSAAEELKQFAEALDDGRERVKFRKATVYRADGTVIPLNTENLAITSPQADDGMYSEAAVLVYSFPEFSAGSALDVITERNVFSPFKKEFFFPESERQTLYPVADWRFSVTVPKGRKFHYAASNFTGELAKYAKPNIKQANGTVTYTWQIKNLPPIIPEAMMPPDGDLYPRVKGALFSGWGPVYDWVTPQYLDRMNPDRELTQLTNRLTANAKTDSEKTAILYHYVQGVIRYTAVKLGMSSNWAGYDANLTWRRKYGCCIDKAILLAVMLKTAGIQAEPFILNPSDRESHDFRVADMNFEHAILRVKTSSGTLFLDPTGNDYQYPYMHPDNYSAGGIAPLSRTTDYITPPPPSENRTVYDYTIAVNRKLEESVNLTASYSGPTEGAQRAAFHDMAPVEREHTVHEWLKQIAPSAKPEKTGFRHLDDFDGHFSIDTSFSLSGDIITAGHLMIFALPGFEQDFIEAGTQSRLYPLVYPVPEETQYNYTITYPKDFDLAALQTPVNITNKFGSFSLETWSERGTIKLKTVFTRTALRVEPQDYAEYREFLNRVSRISRDRIFFSLVVK